VREEAPTLARLHFKCGTGKTLALRGYFPSTLFPVNLICGGSDGLLFSQDNLAYNHFQDLVKNW